MFFILSSDIAQRPAGNKSCGCPADSVNRFCPFKHGYIITWKSEKVGNVNCLFHGMLQNVNMMSVFGSIMKCQPMLTN